MKHLVTVACLLGCLAGAFAEDPAEPPLRPRFRPDVDDVLAIDPTPEKLPPTKINPIEDRVKQAKPDSLPEKLQVPKVDSLPDRIQVPKVESTPALPGPNELPGPAPIPAGPAIDVPFGPGTGRGPLYIDLQTMSAPGRGLAAFLAATPDLPAANWGNGDVLRYRVSDDTAFMMDGLFRGYCRNDGRITWSGVETSFGAEGVLRPSFVSRTGDWVVATEGEFFLNMRYGSSILSSPERDLYRANFDVDMFQIQQLFVEATYGDTTVRIGRSRTPFGRYQSPMFTNSLQDAPFLRTEVISFFETGIFFRYRPNEVVFDLAIVNGEADLDTNSSKAIITRLGYETAFWTVGASIKYQDGISSEWQKRYSNYCGLDGSIALGNWLIYSEIVTDQHGLHRDPTADPNFNPLNFGRRSVYGRDVFSGEDKSAISGVGAHIGVTYRADTWLVDLCYGNYQPKAIGLPSHDASTNRLLFKTAFVAARNLEVFLIALAENRRPNDPPLNNTQPYAFWMGMQYGF
jgi:hypothetical protein